MERECALERREKVQRIFSLILPFLPAEYPSFQLSLLFKYLGF